jgi:hypothetical protein
VAKTIYNMPTTRALLDRLETDSALRASLKIPPCHRDFFARSKGAEMR